MHAVDRMRRRKKAKPTRKKSICSAGETRPLRYTHNTRYVNNYNIVSREDRRGTRGSCNLCKPIRAYVHKYSQYVKKNNNNNKYVFRTLSFQITVVLLIKYSNGYFRLISLPARTSLLYYDTVMGTVVSCSQNEATDPWPKLKLVRELPIIRLGNIYFSIVFKYENEKSKFSLVHLDFSTTNTNADFLNAIQFHFIHHLQLLSFWNARPPFVIPVYMRLVRWRIRHSSYESWVTRIIVQFLINICKQVHATRHLAITTKTSVSGVVQ